MRAEVLLDARQPRGREVHRGRKGRGAVLKGADLHLHSSASDGTDAPEQVVRRARDAGLAAIALTDHDTTAGLEEAGRAGRELGVEVVPGIELSTEHNGREVHLLGYFFNSEDSALSARLEELQVERGRRIERIVALLNGLGLPLTLDAVRSYSAGPSIGRPHVADALVKGGHVSSYEIAWQEFLRPGGRAYVPRQRLPLADAVALVRGAGGVSSVAHPTLNLDLASIDEVAGSGIAGLETTHPKVSEAEARTLGALCRRRGILETGGSDCHGDRRGEPTMGRFRVPLEVLDALRHMAT